MLGVGCWGLFFRDSLRRILFFYFFLNIDFYRLAAKKQSPTSNTQHLKKWHNLCYTQEETTEPQKETTPERLCRS